MRLNQAVMSFALLGATLGLVGCGGGGGSATTEEGGAYTPESTDVQAVSLSDANNQQMAGAEVAFISESDAQSAATVGLSSTQQVDGNEFFPGEVWYPDATAFPGDMFVTLDETGSMDIDLPPGIWYGMVNHLGATGKVMFKVGAGNALSASRISAPLSCGTSACSEINNAIIGSLSGTVYDNNGPIQGALVSLSGGSATNGAYASAVSDVNGSYYLNFNVSSAHSDALAESSLRVAADGYATSSSTIAVNSGNVTGVNIKLSASQATGDIVWRETFENDSETLAGWVIEGGTADTAWVRVESGHGIVNELVDVNVLLAPNDTSEGALPDPVQGQYAYWYGDPAQGNFIGTWSTSTNLNGGSSISSHSGTLTSPSIDLSEVQAPLSLGFNTFWEIESVNPNSNGYDLMSIQVSINGEAFTTIARLNPLSDPQTTLARNALPYTNQGFNQAPMWFGQEPISVDGLAGKSDVRLRFEFRTVDGLYNGFRGWMIDDIRLVKQEGTFPLWSGLNWDELMSEEEWQATSAQTSSIGLPASELPDYVVPSRSR